MDFWTLIEKRRSIRKFTAQEVTPEEEERLVTAANLAPSAGNMQGYGIVAIRDASIKKKLAAAALGQRFIARAPLVLVFYADTVRSAHRYGERGTELYSIQDATIAATFAHLAATDLDLGSVWVGAFRMEEVKSIVNYPPLTQGASFCESFANLG